MRAQPYEIRNRPIQVGVCIIDRNLTLGLIQNCLELAEGRETD